MKVGLFSLQWMSARVPVMYTNFDDLSVLYYQYRVRGTLAKEGKVIISV